MRRSQSNLSFDSHSMMLMMMMLMVMMMMVVMMMVVMIMRRRRKKRNGKNSPSDLPAIPPSSLFRDRSSVSRHSGHFLLPTMPSRTSTIKGIYSSQQVTFAESPSTSSNHKIPFCYFICAVKYIPYYDIVLSLSWNNRVPRFAIVCLLSATAVRRHCTDWYEI